MRLLEQAVDALGNLALDRSTLEHAIDLRLSLCSPLSTLGEIGRARTVLGEAQSWAVELNDSRRLASVLVAILTLDVLTADFEPALEHGARALNQSRIAGDIGSIVIAAVYLGYAYSSLGRLPLAVEHFREALALLHGERRRERYGMRSFPVVFALGSLGLSLAEMGDFKAGVESGQEAVRIAEQLGHAYSQSSAQFHLGHSYWIKGDVDRALRAGEQAVKSARDADSSLGTFMALWLFGEAQTLAGSPGEGLVHLEEAASTARTRQLFVGLPLLLCSLAVAHFRAGREAEAVQNAQEVLALPHRDGKGRADPWALLLLGEVAARENANDADPAKARYEDALRLAEQLCMPPVVVHSHAGLPKLYRRAGKHIESDEHFTTAATMYREMEMTYWLEQIAREMREM